MNKPFRTSLSMISYVKFISAGHCSVWSKVSVQDVGSKLSCEDALILCEETYQEKHSDACDTCLKVKDRSALTIDPWMTPMQYTGKRLIKLTLERLSNVDNNM